MSLQEFFYKVDSKKIIFTEVINYIEENYTYTPSAFSNGTQNNAADQNQGSAKVLAFAKLNKLDKNQTLQLFAEHYSAVLNSPNNEDHQNIRQFMINDWEGVSFENTVLVRK